MEKPAFMLAGKRAIFSSLYQKLKKKKLRQPNEN